MLASFSPSSTNLFSHPPHSHKGRFCCIGEGESSNKDAFGITERKATWLPSPVPKKRSILSHPSCKKREASSVIPPLVGGNEGGRGERGGLGEGLGVRGCGLS